VNLNFIKGIKQFRTLVFLTVVFCATRSFAYRVEMDTWFASSNSSVFLNTWSNTAAQADSLGAYTLSWYYDTNSPNANDVACTRSQWQTIFSAINASSSGLIECPRSAPVARDPTLTNQWAYAGITNWLGSQFNWANTYGYGITRIMFYDNMTTYPPSTGPNYTYTWTTNEVQYMRDWLDANGYTNVELGYDARGFVPSITHWCANPLSQFVLVEASPSGWFSNLGKQQQLLQWLWTNSATNGKELIIDMVDDGVPDPFTQTGTNNFMYARQLVAWMGSTLMGYDFMRSSNVVFKAATYSPGLQFHPEMDANGTHYTNTLTSLTLSLIEQRAFFEGRLSRLPTTADAFSFTRWFPPILGVISNQTVQQGTLSKTIPFTVNDAQTLAASLAVAGNVSNGSLVTGLTFGGGGSTRTVTARLNPALSSSTTITLTVSDGSFLTTNSFLLTVAPANFYTAVMTGAINSNSTWGATIAAPVAGDTNVWQTGAHTLSLTNAVETFNGQTLVIQTNGSLKPGKLSVTFTLNNLVLDGGLITMGNNGGFTNDLNGQQFTLNSGTLQSGQTIAMIPNVVFRNGTLAGGGTINITGATTNGADVEFQSTIDTTGFTGTFSVYSNGILNLPAISIPTFGLNLSGSGKYFNDTNVALTSLIINGTAFTNGTYTYNSFTAAQKTNLLNNGGTITVWSNTPPTLSSLGDVVIDENTSTNFSFTVGDASTAASNLVVSGYSSNPALIFNDNLTFGGSGTNRTVNLAPLAYQYGTAAITVAVSDGWFSTSCTFNVTVNPPAKPTISLASFSNGQLNFTINGTNGPDYIVFASTNLINWSPLWTNKAPVLPFSYTNFITTNFSRRFYRVLLGP